MKKQTLWFALLSGLLLAPCAPLVSLDSVMVAGREDRWEEFQLDDIALKQGRWGTLDLVLRDNEYTAKPGTDLTDLMLHFDGPAPGDESGHYRVVEARLHFSEPSAAMGAAAAAFSGAESVLRLRALAGALLEPGTRWGDFTIEFWLNPALLSEGEEILSWTGSRWQGGEALPQKVSCAVAGRRLTWSFENFLLTPEGGSRSVSLAGLTPLVPRNWHHHLLRYDSGRGMMEYLVDGIPEAVAYTTVSGGERGNLLFPVTGDAGSGDLEIGGGFVGFLDELRISRLFIEEPSLSRYGGYTGVAALREPFDLGYTGTRVKRIDAVWDAPSDSAVFFFYRLSDNWDVDVRGERWLPFTPGRALAGARGRYLQVMVELLPDGRRSRTPQVSELRVVYEQDLPPPPPTGLYAVSEDGAVRLYWNTVNEQDVRGYLVYYGDAPGNYHGVDSQLGASPLRVGKVSEIRIPGLRNRKLYYFTVVAYDATEPPHRSLFAKEVSARPAEMHTSSIPAGQAVQ